MYLDKNHYETNIMMDCLVQDFLFQNNTNRLIGYTRFDQFHFINIHSYLEWKFNSFFNCCGLIKEMYVYPIILLSVYF